MGEKPWKLLAGNSRRKLVGQSMKNLQLFKELVKENQKS